MTRAQRLLSMERLTWLGGSNLFMSLKSAGFALAVALLLSSFSLVTTARADIVVAGSTAGAFFDASNVNQGNSIDHLSFSGTSFGPVSSDQVLTLGSFTLANGMSTYDDYAFALTVSFTSPAGTFGNSGTGTLTGSLHGNDGSVYLKFPTSSPFSYTGGSFNLLVHDFSLVKPSTRNPSVSGFLYGTITDVTTSVPEPRPYDFLITAIGGVVFLLYRHRYGRC